MVKGIIIDDASLEWIGSMLNCLITLIAVT